MASSGGLWTVAFFLVVQVLAGTESSPTNGPPRQLINGSPYPGRNHPGSAYLGASYPWPEYPGPTYPRPEYPGPAYPVPEYPGPAHPVPEYAGSAQPTPRHQKPTYPTPEYPGPAQLTPRYHNPTYSRPEYPGPAQSTTGYHNPTYPTPEYPEPTHPTPEYHGSTNPGPEPPLSRRNIRVHGHPKSQPKYSEDQAAVLIGNDIELPYALYKQIIKSYKSSDTILCLLPSNTIRSVAGYAELKDTVKAYGTDTKVIISKDIMIPADVYLRIVVLNPEEVMVQLPNGEVIPNIIFLEQLEEKVEVQDMGGQKYYAEDPRSEYDDFLIEDDTRNYGHPGKPEHNPRSGFNGIEENPEPQESFGSPHYSPTSLQKPAATSNHYDALPKSVHQLPYPVIPQKPTALPLPTPASPVDIQPIVLTPPEFEKRPQNLGPLSRGSHLPAPPCATSTHFPHHGGATHCPESRNNIGEQRTYLPSGIHFIDTARCHICDPSSHAPHFTVFNV